VEIFPGVHKVPSVRWTRAYLIVGETLALVDSGLPWNPSGIVKYIRSIGRDPSELRQILVTHSHPDHTGGTLSLVKATGALVVAHRSDTKRLDGNRAILAYIGNLGKVNAPLPFMGKTPVASLVNDGDVLPIHGGVRVIHTPGHTSGSVCYLLEDLGLLFSGDTIFSNGDQLSRSVPFPGYDRERYIRSLKRLSDFGFEGVCGGHGEPLRAGGSAKLRALLKESPNPPTWGGFFKSIPRRLSGAGVLTGEHI
jgi:glyoxylase-like metal-dependent hydrolase (beta-lactamase superfamily II)